ncbi:MAG: energy transducer TonB [Lysobacterales bacterium]
MIRIILIFVVLLAGCVTTRFGGNPVRQINEQSRAIDLGSRVGDPSPEVEEKLRQLYSDRPELLDSAAPPPSLLDGIMPRVKSMTPPKYPINLFYGKVESQVTVAFVVNENGKVTDPRVFEAADGRFVDAALDSVKKWKFTPGTVKGKAAKFLLIVPIRFRIQE